MDNISTEDLGKYLPNDDGNNTALSRDDQRRLIKSFKNDESVRKYILADEIKSSILTTEDTSLKGVLLFTSPSLTSLQQQATDRDDVQERRKTQIEKKTRGNIIYNEAVRYGAQVALKNTLMEFQSHIRKENSSLEANYNFSNYMLHKNTVIPPIININQDGVKVSDDKFTKFDFRYSITSQAKFTERIPNYRDYLSFQEYSVRDPSIFNIPVTQNELTYWMNGIFDGWKRGDIQAEIEIDNAISRLKLDFLGMVRYHMLRKKNMVSEPVISKSTLGLSGDQNSIDIGVVNFVMDGVPVFELDMNNWTPLPMIDEVELKEFIKRKDGGK